MGFGSLATYVILFTVGVGMVTGLMFTFRDFFSTSSSSIEIRQSIRHDRLSATMGIQNATYQEGGIMDSIVWETDQNFEDGIFENTTTDDDRLSLEGDNVTGVWYSDIREIEGPLNFTSLSADGLDAIPDSIRIRIRTAGERQHLTGSFLGPDGTGSPEDFYELEMDQDINDVHDGDQVIQVQVLIEDELTGDTSYLDNLEISFEYIATIDVHIRNTGTLELDEDRLDFFVIGERIPRDSILEMMVIEEDGLPNPGIWDSETDLWVRLATGPLETSALFTVTNEYGAKGSRRITMEG